MKAVREKAKSLISGRLLISEGSKNSYFHWHDKCEVCKMISGSCGFLVDGKLVEAKQGDIIFIDENSFHQFVTNDDRREMKMIQFTKNVITDSQIPFVPLKTYVSAEELHAIPGLEEKLDFLLDIVIAEQSVTGSVLKNPYLKSIVEAFYHLMARYFADDKNTVKKDKTKFHDVLEYIKNHYTEDITVNDIGAKLYMSRTQLAYLFSKYTGLGINEYINTLRVRHVNNLLLQDKSITDAAVESGFSSIRTFNHVYKKYTGITPTEYVNTFVNNLNNI